MRYALGGLAGIALVGVIVLTALEAGTRMQELRGGTAGAAPAGDVNELAQRLLAPPYPMPDGGQQSVTLNPGALPKNASFEMPIPSAARLVGSVTRERTVSGSTIASYDVVIDVPGSADDVTAFYDRELPKKGLNPFSQPQPPQQGGFVASFGPTNNRIYCKSDQQGPYVTVTVFTKPGAPNDVRAHYEPGNTPGMGTPCFQKGGGPQPFPSKLPALRAPDGVTLQPNGSGMGNNRQSSEATAVTSRSVSELESAFAAQLTAAGWTRVAGKADGPLAYSTWKIPGDGDWQGLLLVIESPGKDRRALTVRAETPTGF